MTMEYQFDFDFFKEIYWVIEDLGIFKYLLLMALFAIRYPDKESPIFHNQTIAFLTTIIICALISLFIMGSRIKNIEIHPNSFALTKVSGSQIILNDDTIKSIRSERITRSGYIDEYFFGGGESSDVHCRIIIETLDGKSFFTTEESENDCLNKALEFSASLLPNQLTHLATMPSGKIT